MVARFVPFSAPAEEWLKDAKGMTNGECVIVAVSSEPIFGLEERKRTLSAYASEISSETGLPSVVTEDLLSYIALCRMERRGYDEESVKKVLDRLSHIREQCYLGE